MLRRSFLHSAAAAGGLTILRAGLLRGRTAPSNRLNIALAGVWGRGAAHYDALSGENVVALCDANELRTRQALAIFPRARTYWDWRRMLEQKDIEAVVICTPDHHHALIANWAMNRGMHVYCEKPLGLTVEEVRTVRANYRKNRARLATQHGTQRHAFPNFERLRELILDGAMGDLHTVHGWDSRQVPRPPGYPPADGSPPAGLHFDQWLGPAAGHPYSPRYFGGPCEWNCLFWNQYRDFGMGQAGDMGAHTMDLIWNALDAGAPVSAEADRSASDAYQADIAPLQLKVAFEHPANSWRGPVTVVWYQGGLKPESPKSYLDLRKIPNGALFEGTRGSILADFTSRVLIPHNDDGDLTYYQRRAPADLLPLVEVTGQVTQRAVRAGATDAGEGRVQVPAGMAALLAADPTVSAFPAVRLLEDGLPPALGLPNAEVARILGLQRAGTLPSLGNSLFQLEWIDACKGEGGAAVHGTSSKTHCDFEYAGSMMEQQLLGLVAQRAGKRLEYDPLTGRITNHADANDWLKRRYPTGWELNG